MPEELERLISIPGVDWTGNFINKCEFSFKPVPVITKDSMLFSMILYWNKVLQAALLPANPEDVFAELGRLKLHFPGTSMSERENELLIRDYIADLSLFPMDLIELVCREYRLNGDNKFFPKLGTLRSMLIIHFTRRISKSNRLLALIEAAENGYNPNQNY